MRNKVIVGYMTPDGRYLCDPCVDDVNHDVADCQPVHLDDFDAADVRCEECGESRESLSEPEWVAA